jgi:micrococcal nuclease
MRLLIISAFLLFANCKSNSSEKLPLNFTGKVVGIKDGDTFQVLYQKQTITVRLAHIDCPEKKQPFGKMAKQFASDLCFGKEVQVKSEGKTDRYKRIIATIYLGDICINEELVKNGYAWHFIKYSNEQYYTHLESEARQKKLGLWADINPIAPWSWREK